MNYQYGKGIAGFNKRTKNLSAHKWFTGKLTKP